jgi:hypothetical protein
MANTILRVQLIELEVAIAKKQSEIDALNAECRTGST